MAYYGDGGWLAEAKAEEALEVVEEANSGINTSSLSTP